MTPAGTPAPPVTPAPAPAGRRSGAVGTAAVAAVLALTVAVAGWAWYDRAHVLDRPLPSKDASVTEVATAYLDAAVRQDCAFTGALTIEPEFSWCDGPRLLAWTDLQAPTLLAAAYAGRDQHCVESTMTHTASGDGSMEAGTGPWSLCFVATPEGWRVSDQGFL